MDVNIYFQDVNIYLQDVNRYLQDVDRYLDLNNMIVEVHIPVLASGRGGNINRRGLLHLLLQGHFHMMTTEIFDTHIMQRQIQDKLPGSRVRGGGRRGLHL